MKINTLYLNLLVCLFSVCLQSQTQLKASGSGNTYELINNVLSPGYDAVEVPDCSHKEFGEHIKEVYDEDLKEYVFEFYIHQQQDNDRCENFDRQRVEIKTYSASPENLKGRVGEIVTYKWLFKLPLGFQPSTTFTHIHQIKAVGGSDGLPVFTLSLKKGNENRINLVHDNKSILESAFLSDFLGNWVEVEEVIKIGDNGSYYIKITRINDSKILMSYSNDSIITIRSDNDFIRPKWGIYRSLKKSSDLRDESIRFADFYIAEN